MPDWIRHAVIYHILIDRFAGYNSGLSDAVPDFCGGNIKGITAKLDYIKWLGFNSILISPFYQTSAYHGYHITGFEQVDKRFGSNDDIAELIIACHHRGLRIIADFVPNHCSAMHPWFLDAKANKAKSNFYNWFYFEKNSEKYLCFLDYKELPKLNLENNETADYMLRVASGWLRLGFDGFRIDHVTGVPDQLLKKLRNCVKEINPEFVLIGEAWNEGLKYRQLKTLRFKGRYQLWKTGFNQSDIQNHYHGIIDGVFDFAWRSSLLENLYHSNGKTFQPPLSGNVNPHFVSLRFLDNHDTSRIMHFCKNNKSLFKSVLKYLFGQPQPVVFYQGTEYALTHKEPLSAGVPYSDLFARTVIPWQFEPYYAAYIKELIDGRYPKI